MLARLLSVLCLHQLIVHTILLSTSGKKIVVPGSQNEINNIASFQSSVSSSQPLNNGTSFDLSWDFIDGKEGWAEATLTEMQAEVSHYSGQLRLKFTGQEVHFDSPLMNLYTSERQTFVIRYRYIGESRSGKVTLYGIKEAADGSMSDEQGLSAVDLYFPIIGDGLFHESYATFYEMPFFNVVKNKFHGSLHRLRVSPGLFREKISKEPSVGEIFFIDWIRIVRGPIIERVLGCPGESFSSTRDFEESHAIVATETAYFNNFLTQYSTKWQDPEEETSLNSRYARSYNCKRSGGERITVIGKNFGTKEPSQVTIGGQLCGYVVHHPERPQEELSCETPPMNGILNPNVMVRNGLLSELVDTVPYFHYAVPPPKPVDLSFSNIASRSIDMTWGVGGNYWEQMVYTGFFIQWKVSTQDGWTSSIVVGNITTTTLGGLERNTEYEVKISGIAEDQNNPSWKALDSYGRRDILQEALIGESINATVHTLSYDFQFEFFNANMTRNHGPISNSSALGPTGINLSEGHYGLNVIGDASVENCNASSICCDILDEDGSCNATALMCGPSFLLRGKQQSDEHSPHDLAIVQSKTSTASVYASSNLASSNANGVLCGPALRLTGSSRELIGGAYYPRKVSVEDGFDTHFTFRISNPSQRCNNLDNVRTRCRSRGADGFAFLIQNHNVDAIGGGGHNLGYGGIPNSVAIEFDTYYNFDDFDPYENHVSVHTKGGVDRNSPNETFSLGVTNNIPDLTDGMIDVRIKYVPTFDSSEIQKHSFMASPYILADRNWVSGGLGMLFIYLEKNTPGDHNTDNFEPRLVIPMNISNILGLEEGRAWVGFTGSTGSDSWQSHDLLRWDFSSLRLF
uniref:Fibronectin type-III domain-containing protein n=1 Tax=Leptocylindrus danicus TaxID=163516 RepID=A0A7S2PFY5_9STRA|mmetsp:Transcript_32617/g.47230  ORF Transcript_32617/g.47230 Transcript_32617/m.47230 type:complete len:857 (+) Transcript_32617:970-3540(+)